MKLPNIQRMTIIQIDLSANSLILETKTLQLDLCVKRIFQELSENKVTLIHTKKKTFGTEEVLYRK